jgi:glycosyltransferase involved in cell wall biosynthesis
LKVLINAIGISDSGGITVIEKLIKEFIAEEKDNKFTFLITKNPQIDLIVEKYIQYSVLEFRNVSFKGYLGRLIYENITLRGVIAKYNINLMYNFSGTGQFFIQIPQLIKIHNLLFYSQKLDKSYQEKSHIFLWLKQVFLKRQLLRLMISRSRHVEIQSKHVSEHLSDFIDTSKKSFYIKSDIDLCDDLFKTPREYDFSKKIKILYVVGPHFKYLHKNVADFTHAMVSLRKAGLNFEINITLTSEQLNLSTVWDESLNCITNFHGYVSDPKKMDKLYSDNTVLISTSIIETLGLHVIEAIQQGVVFIVPDEIYAREVYGNVEFSYELFDSNSLCKVLMRVISNVDSLNAKILEQQNYLKKNESEKIGSILEIFREVLNV